MAPTSAPATTASVITPPGGVPTAAARQALDAGGPLGAAGAGIPAPGASPPGRGSRSPLRGFPPLPGQPDPVYPPGQFSLWNRSSVRTAWLGIAPSADASRESEADPGYAHFAISDSSADATSTQTWAAIDDTGAWATPRSGRRAAAYTDHGTYPGGSSEPPRALGSVAGPARDTRGGAGSPPASGQPPGRRTAGAGGPDDIFGGAPAAGDLVESAAPARPGARRQLPGGGSAAGTRGGRATADGRGARGRAAAARAVAARARRGGSARSNRLLAVLLAAPVLVVIGVVGVLVYMNSGSAGPSRPASAATPRAVPTSAAPTLGPWKHIDSRADDPQALTLPELFPARFDSSGVVAVRTAERVATDCTHAVIGGALRSAVHKAGCTQAMRASYLTSDRKMMATIGVLNLATAAEAKRVGRTSGSSEFIKQLPSRRGPTKKLTRGTGLEEAEYKGHYLILVWGEFANLHTPSGKRQKLQLVQFFNALINGTVNISLSSRMVTGQPTVTP